MLKIYLASLRVAIAIVCVGISLIFASRMLGLVPQSAADNGRAMMRLIAFFIVGGVSAYTLLVVRLIGSFEVTQVVTDRVRQSLDALSEGLIVTDENEKIVLANRSFCETVGLSDEQLIGRKISSLTWVCSRSTTAADYPWSRAHHEQKRQTDQLMRYRHLDGSYRFLSINASPIAANDTNPGGVLATFRDVTLVEEHRAEVEQMLQMLRRSREEISSQNRELQILASKDALTGCLNRRALFEKFDSLWNDRRDSELSIACLMIDNDHFKQVNDRYGHSVGDQVLRTVSAILNESFDEHTLVCRYGGEEFCVVIPLIKVEDAAHIAEQTRVRISRYQMTELSELKLSVSIGVSHASFGATNPQSLINQADCALYEAKGNGRNQINVFGTPNQYRERNRCAEYHDLSR